MRPSQTLPHEPRCSKHKRKDLKTVRSRNRPERRTPPSATTAAAASNFLRRSHSRSSASPRSASAAWDRWSLVTVLCAIVSGALGCGRCFSFPRGGCGKARCRRRPLEGMQLEYSAVPSVAGRSGRRSPSAPAPHRGLTASLGWRPRRCLHRTLAGHIQKR